MDRGRGRGRSKVEGEERKSKTDHGTSDNCEVYRLQKTQGGTGGGSVNSREEKVSKLCYTMVEVLLESCGQEVAVTVDDCPSFEQTNLTPIQKFYYGQSIFITGGTGFLGKLLIEKLLRVCPGVSVIYLLVRQKKGRDAYERIEGLFDDPLFSKLKEKEPKFRHRVVAVAGDCCQTDLGMSKADRETITREVSVVFHVAATVRFDEKMKLAVPINVQSPKAMIDLCKQMPRLKSFVHVSTAYAYCPYKVVEERTYDPPMEVDKLITLVESMDDQLLEKITPRLLGEWPNTYTFTKALGESVVVKEAGNLPVGIFRPAIVVSTYRDPLAGWIDNLYGPTGVVAGAGTGILRSLHCDGSVQANVVPGDLTVNGLIACAWDVTERRKAAADAQAKSPGDIPIYNYVSDENPISYDQLKTLSEKYGLEFPPSKAVWYYGFRNTKYKIVHLFLVFVLHMVPALLTDAVSICLGKQPRMWKMYKKIHKFLDVIEYFATRQWNFTNNNVQIMASKLREEDQENFLCDIKKVNWHEFFRTYVQGIRVYLIKDPLSTLPQARLKWQRLYWIHQTLKVIVAYGLLRMSWLTLSFLLRRIGLFA